MTGYYSKTYFLHKNIISESLCQGDYIHYPLSIIIHGITMFLSQTTNYAIIRRERSKRTFEKRNVQDLYISSQNVKHLQA